MRFGPDDTFWVVTNPSPVSTLEDVLFETSLRELELQFKGGLTIDANPTIFTDRSEARVEADRRLVATRAHRAILEGPPTGIALNGARHIRILDGDGMVLIEADLR